MSISFSEKDRLLLRKLNRGSWTHTFSPDSDIDWDTSTTDEEFRTLYDVWSLLQGTRHEASLNDEQRIRFAKYQQMNLMLGTALFERCALANLESLYSDDADPAYQEYVSHLIKEETYHYLLFSRAVARIMETDPTLCSLPSRPLKVYLSVVFFVLRCVPSRRMRHGMFFFLLHFVEQITLQAYGMTRRTIARGDSFVLRVWQLHAIDESRHVAFDNLMMRKARLPGVFGKIPVWLTAPLCIGASLLFNLNEIWAARKLGVRVGYHELPMLMKHTTAPFKRKLFRSLVDDIRKAESPAT